MNTRVLVLSALMTSSLAAHRAAAWNEPDDGALGGPRVVTPEKPATITEREMNGSLKALDTRPEQAALKVMDLTAEERAATEKVLLARATAVSALLAEHQDLFLKLQQARQGNASREEMAPLMREFRPLAAPLVSPSLLDQLTDVLPKEKAERLRALVGEYVSALAAEGAKQGRGAGEGARRQRGNGEGGAEGAKSGPVISERMEINLLLREMARSLNGLVEERRAQSDAMMQAIDATPEQAEQIRAIVRGTGDGTGLRPSREQRAEVRRKIMAILTPEQQKKLAEYQRGTGGTGENGGSR